MGAIFFRLLRHQPDIGDRAHGLRIKSAIGLAVFDHGLEQPRIAAVWDHCVGVMQLAIRAPHLARFTNHRRHGSIHDGIAGDMQIRDAAV